MKAISGMTLTLTGMFALWSSGPIWFFYTLYELFANDGSFWSTIGVAIIGLVVQLIVGFVATITGAVLMELSSDRFVKDVRKGDFRKSDKRKDKVLSGYSKIMALLSRASK